MKLRWGRILIAGVVAELALFAVIPLNFVPGGPAILQVIVIPVCLLATFVGGWWAARKASGAFVLHGLLVGALAALIYFGLGLVAPGETEVPAIYTVANGLKLLGGAAGGWFAARRAGPVAG